MPRVGSYRNESDIAAARWVRPGQEAGSPAEGDPGTSMRFPSVGVGDTIGKRRMEQLGSKQNMTTIIDIARDIALASAFRRAPHFEIGGVVAEMRATRDPAELGEIGLRRGADLRR